MYPTLEKIKELAQSGEYRRIPVCRELYSDRYTPVEVMRTLLLSSGKCQPDRGMGTLFLPGI